MEAVFGFGKSHSQGGNGVVKTHIESLGGMSVAAMFPVLAHLWSVGTQLQPEQHVREIVPVDWNGVRSNNSWRRVIGKENGLQGATRPGVRGSPGVVGDQML